jgi:hypothetical protein
MNLTDYQWNNRSEEGLELSIDGYGEDYDLTDN